MRFRDKRDWFFEKRFGMFIHWGIYALQGWHEQDQLRRSIPRAVYEAQAQQFNPQAFNPEAWLDVMQQVGMEYLVFTAKHHDGFCLWDTDETEYKITNTPYGRDILAELADACHRRGIVLGIYYSVVDWHHPSYPNQGRHHELPSQPGDKPDMPAYVDYLKRQVRELCTRYGEIGYIWWDMNVPEYVDESVNAMIRDLQPGAMINERGLQRRDIDDVQWVVTPEREYESSGDISRSGVFNRPVEACNGVDSLSWGYKADGDLYMPRHIKAQMTKCLTRGGNYLLNIGPDADGRIPPAQMEMLEQIGAWYKIAKPALLAEPAGHLSDNSDVLLTRCGNTLYVCLPIPPITQAIRLRMIDILPSQALLVNTGQVVDACVDTIPHDASIKALRLRGLPQEILNNDVAIIRCDFDHLPKMFQTNNCQTERI